MRVGAGLPGLAAVWPSLRLRRPPTPDDVVVARVVSAQCRSHRPVILLVAVPVMAVIRGCPPSRRGLAAVMSSLEPRVAGLPGLAAVWPSLRLRCPPTPDDVVVARVVSAQCRSHRPVVLLVAIPVMAVIRGCSPSRRGLAAVPSRVGRSRVQPRTPCCYCGCVHVLPVRYLMCWAVRIRWLSVL